MTRIQVQGVRIFTALQLLLYASMPLSECLDRLFQRLDLLNSGMVIACRRQHFVLPSLRRTKLVHLRLEPPDVVQEAGKLEAQLHTLLTPERPVIR